MARTTELEVKAILDTSLTDLEVLHYINVANRIVTRQLSGEGLTDALLKDIETWYTAHLIAITKERQPTEEKVGDIWLRFGGTSGARLEATTYGQQVLTMDSSGKMQQAMKKRASIRAIQQDRDDTSEVETDQW